MKRLTMLLVTICTVFVLHSFIDYKDAKQQLAELENICEKTCRHSNNSADKTFLNVDRTSTRRFY